MDGLDVETRGTGNDLCVLLMSPCRSDSAPQSVQRPHLSCVIVAPTSWNANPNLAISISIAIAGTKKLEGHGAVVLVSCGADASSWYSLLGFSFIAEPNSFCFRSGASCFGRSFVLQQHCATQSSCLKTVSLVPSSLDIAFRVARLTLQTRKLWCRDRPARYL